MTACANDYNSFCLQCTGAEAIAVIGYLYTDSISNVEMENAAEVISLANLWQLPGTFCHCYLNPWMMHSLNVCYTGSAGPARYVLEQATVANQIGPVLS